MSAYYNEIDPFAAAWLRELIADGHIAPGDVDERDIRDVLPSDLGGYTQCHFFAGIGGWSLALRLAGWPDDRPIWTGSAPCQPFSAAGAGGGFTDDRHLWPAFHWLIAQCQPPVVVGEQVDAAVRHGWLDLVQADLEREGYAFGVVDLPAASVGAPHIRQRLWWVAESNDAGQHALLRPEQGDSTQDLRGCEAVRLERHMAGGHESQPEQLADRTEQGRESWWAGQASNGGDTARVESGRLRVAGKLAHSGSARLQELSRRRDEPSRPAEASAVSELAHTSCERRQQDPRSASGDEAADGRTGRDGSQPDGDHQFAGDGADGGGGGLADADGGQSRHGDVQPGGVDGLRTEGRRADGAARVSERPEGFWSRAIWLPCRDNKARPVEPGIFPLATGVPNRVGTLRGAGNAIVPQVAAEVIRAYMSISEQTANREEAA